MSYGARMTQILWIYADYQSAVNPIGMYQLVRACSAASPRRQGQNYENPLNK
jgi:hypothetical protein